MNCPGPFWSLRQKSWAAEEEFHPWTVSAKAVRMSWVDRIQVLRMRDYNCRSESQKCTVLGFG